MHQREPARLGREPARVRVGADARRLEETGARDHDGTRQHFLARVLGHRLGFTGQQRLVELQAVAGTHGPVGGHLIPRTEIAEVAQHDLVDRDLLHLAVADDPCLGCGEHREPVERPLRAPLLHDTDQRVEQQHEAEQRVLTLAEDEDEHEHRAENRVEPRQDVRAENLTERAAGAIVGDVHLALTHTQGDVIRREPGVGRDDVRSRQRGIAHRVKPIGET